MAKPKKSVKHKNSNKQKKTKNSHRPKGLNRKTAPAAKRQRQPPTINKSSLAKQKSRAKTRTAAHKSSTARTAEQRKYRPPAAKDTGEKGKSPHRHKTKTPVKKSHSPSALAKAAQKGSKRVSPEKKKRGLKAEQKMPASWAKAIGFVPPELEKMAVKALSKYGLKAESMLVMATKPLKGGAIWQVKTKKGVFGLKLLHRRPSRSLFSIGAQAYLSEKKARVPQLIPCENGKFYVELGKKLWIVSKWIKSLTPAPKDLKGAKMLSNELGEFHQLSRGYIPLAGAEYSSRLARWPDYFEKMITKFGWFRALARAYHDTPAGPALLSALEVFEPRAQAALERLYRSPYTDLISRGESHWGFAHQDYGWGNAQLGPGGVYVIDLDGVAFDLPIRDLRKLISNVMKESKTWDLKLIKEMISAYHKANPIEPELYEVFLTDLSLPNEFYQFIKGMVYNPETFLNNETKKELEAMVTAEKSKQRIVEKLSAWEVE